MHLLTEGCDAVTFVGCRRNVVHKIHEIGRGGETREREREKMRERKMRERRDSKDLQTKPLQDKTRQERVSKKRER